MTKKYAEKCPRCRKNTFGQYFLDKSVFGCTNRDCKYIGLFTPEREEKADQGWGKEFDREFGTERYFDVPPSPEFYKHIEKLRSFISQILAAERAKAIRECDKRLNAECERKVKEAYEKGKEEVYKKEGLAITRGHIKFPEEMRKSINEVATQEARQSFKKEVLEIIFNSWPDENLPNDIYAERLRILKSDLKQFIEKL